MYQLTGAVREEFPRLLEIWEASVRATHDFLQEEDIQFFKTTIEEHDVFAKAALTCARTSDQTIAGFLGISDDSLEMLFVHPDYIGKGAGKQLTLHAIQVLGVKKVDVNEQNVQAKNFYEHFGFVTISRSELDSTGRPFPILHMKLL